ncbi:MAG: winged helix-turn-helix domain-containing protein [Vicinamibacterales bacterium]
MDYSFGTFTFSPASLELTRDGRPVRLEPQPARALALLLARAGDVVSRDDLRAALWDANTHVDFDRGLAYCLAQVRTALGDSADNPRFVQTLPKRGFRFIAPVAVVPATSGGPAAPAVAVPPAPAAPPPPATRAATPGSRWLAGRRPWLAGVAAALVVTLIWLRADTPPSPTIIAVSIFDNETDDPGLDRFVTGLSDLVVTRLTALAPDRVGVIGNSAALRRPRAIRNLQTLAREVEADYLVIGQLQRQDEGLRFILHFIRLSDGVHLSAQRLVRENRDVTGFDEDVVGEAERVVRVHVLAADAP